MKQEPKITSVTKYREKFITEHIDGTFTVSNFQYPTFEKAKEGIDKILNIKKL